ncbi:MAG: cytochrome c [SAR324 cluster bacterium]|nr:cytochrome c [SAR324 cluster bacterium]
MKKTGFYKNLTKYCVSVGIIVWTIASCAPTGTDETAEYQTIDADTPVTFDILHDTVLKPLCVRCHDWANTETETRNYIYPGVADYSELYKVVTVGEPIMPPGGPELTVAQKELVSRYIEETAVK